MIAADGVLARLLEPLAPAEFAASYCAVRPLLLRGRAGKFDWLLDGARFRALLAERLAGRADLRCGIHALQHSRADEPLTLMSWQRIGADQLEQRLAAGETVCVNKLSEEDAGLRGVARAAADELGWTGTAWLNAYLSPPGSGADLHWDAQITTSLQLAGRKRWTYATTPSLAWPARPAQVDREGVVRYFAPAARQHTTRDVELREVVLEPGDLLCLPAGTLHAAKALDESLALNLALGAPEA